MTDEEMIAVLEEIIFDPKAPGSARVTAIRTLHEWRRAEPEEGPSPFDPLYPYELRERSRWASPES
jgi:hypothetical protein